MPSPKRTYLTQGNPPAPQSSTNSYIGPQQKQVSDASTQTLNEEKQLQTEMSYCDQNFGAQLAVVLIKMIQIKQNYSIQNHLTAVTKVMKDVMGIKIDQEQLMNLVDEKGNDHEKSNPQPPEINEVKTSKRKSIPMTSSGNQQGEMNSSQNLPISNSESRPTHRKPNHDKVSVDKYSDRGKQRSRGKQFK